MARVHEPTFHLFVKREAALREASALRNWTCALLPALLSRTTVYATDSVVVVVFKKQCYSQFSDLFMKATAWSDFSRD